MIERVPTASLAAAGLIGGFGVAVGTGSRPLGGLVLAAFGLPCIAIWLRRDGRAETIRLTIAGLLAFAISHGLGLLIGAWPSVFVVAALIAALYWHRSDARVITRVARADASGALAPTDKSNPVSEV